jgi:O-antigen/teichoic acid export membrane protein
MSYSKLAIKGIFWSLVQVASERTTQTVVFLVAAAVLGPREFGIAALATSPAIIMMTTLQSGSQVIVQRAEADQDFGNSAFLLFSGLGLIGALLISILAGILHTLPDATTIAKLMAPTAIVPLVVGFAVIFEGMLMRAFAYKLLAIRRTVGQIAAGSLCCALALSGFGAWSIVAQVILAPLVASAISIVTAGWRPTKISGVRSSKEILHFSSIILGMSAVTQVNIRSADVIVGAIAGPAATGVFRLSRTAFDLAASLFLNPINGILLPIFSRMVDDRSRTVEAMWQVCRVTCILATIPMVAAPLIGPYLSHLVLHDKWPHLVETVSVLLIALPVMALTTPLQVFLVASGSPLTALKNNIVQAVANIVMVAVGAYFGIVWAALMFTVRCALGMVGLLITLQRREPALRMRDALFALVPAALGLVVVTLALISVKMLNIDMRALAAAFWTGCFGFFGYLLAIFLIFPDRIKQLRTAIRRK